MIPAKRLGPDDYAAASERYENPADLRVRALFARGYLLFVIAVFAVIYFSF